MPASGGYDRKHIPSHLLSLIGTCAHTGAKDDPMVACDCAVEAQD